MSVIHKFSGNEDDYSWIGVDGIPLNDDGLEMVTKHILIGENEDVRNYIMRYFHLEPGGHSKLERHPQEHEVIVLHGAGEVQIEDRSTQVERLDVVFIEGNDLHQFRASPNQALGFICVIPK